MIPLVLAVLLGQQFPPEAEPVQPSVQVPVLFMLLNVPPAVLDLPSAAPGTPIRQLLLCPRNVFKSQAECATYAASGETRANNVYKVQANNPTRVVVIPVYLSTYSAPNNMSTELTQMQQNTLSGVNVAQLKADYHADRTTLVDHDGSACGLGYMNASLYGSAWAYSVENKDCLSNSSLHHEWGHNDGLCHDTPNASGCTPAKPYGFGWCDPTSNAQSPMTYPQPCNKPRTYFSDQTNTTLYGHPYGDATHDEAAVQAWGMPIEAAFTSEPDPNRPVNH